MPVIVPQFEIQSITAGIVKLFDKDAFRLHVLMEGKRWEAEKYPKRRYMQLIKETKPNSIKQQKYYRKVLCQWAGGELGYSGSEMHGVYQGQGFFTVVGNDGLPRVRSTAIGEWTTVEWEAKMVEIRRWLAEDRGIPAPEPNQCTWL